MQRVAKFPEPKRSSLAEQATPPAAAHDPGQFSLEQLLTPQELAARWRVSTKTLANQRWLQEGCPFLRLGRVVRYRQSDVLAVEAAARVADDRGAASPPPSGRHGVSW